MSRNIDEQLLLDDFSISHWLKNQIRETKQRDILDALIDAQMLSNILEQRCISAGLIVNAQIRKNENHD